MQLYFHIVELHITETYVDTESVAHFGVEDVVALVLEALVRAVVLPALLSVGVAYSVVVEPAARLAVQVGDTNELT